VSFCVERPVVSFCVERSILIMERAQRFNQSKIPPGPLPARRLIDRRLTGRRVGSSDPYGFRLVVHRAYSSERPEAEIKNPKSNLDGDP
jgi:hypothetical protein